MGQGPLPGVGRWPPGEPGRAPLGQTWSPFARKPSWLVAAQGPGAESVLRLFSETVGAGWEPGPVGSASSPGLGPVCSSPSPQHPPGCPLHLLVTTRRAGPSRLPANLLCGGTDGALPPRWGVPVLLGFALVGPAGLGPLCPPRLCCSQHFCLQQRETRIPRSISWPPARSLLFSVSSGPGSRRP